MKARYRPAPRVVQPTEDDADEYLDEDEDVPPLPEALEAAAERERRKEKLH